jgi:hypothetical protein
MKGKKQDLQKAIHFIEMIIERDYETEKENKPNEDKDNSWGIITK